MTQISVRRAELPDIEKAKEHLGRWSQLELDKWNLTEAMLASTQAYVGLIDGEIVMVGGIIPGTMLSGRSYLWSLQTEAARKKAVAFIRGTRRWIDSLNTIVYCHSRYDGRWLKLIGFKELGGEDGLVEYEYDGRH